jgi:hypothetical protein
MFSGARLPAPRVIDLALAGAERWLATPSPAHPQRQGES